jgi:hypothetical protein
VHHPIDDGWQTLYVVRTPWGGTALIQKRDGDTRTVTVR